MHTHRYAQKSIVRILCLNNNQKEFCEYLSYLRSYRPLSDRILFSSKLYGQLYGRTHMQDGTHLNMSGLRCFKPVMYNLSTNYDTCTERRVSSQPKASLA